MGRIPDLSLRQWLSFTLFLAGTVACLTLMILTFIFGFLSSPIVFVKLYLLAFGCILIGTVIGIDD